MQQTLTRLSRKKNQLDQQKPLPPEVVSNLGDWFRVELTYTSNAIEGNTLSRAETALVVEKGLTVEGKTLKDHLEAINHAQALDFIRDLASKKRAAITQRVILDIHKFILSRIDDAHAGRYRSVPVRVAGSRVILPNPAKVPNLMDEFETWLKSQSKARPATVAAEAHYRLVTIHPFTDGNGRTARLLMNLILIQAGYPPAIIRYRDRRANISAIEKAQLGGSMDTFLELVYQSIERSLDIYLEYSGQKPVTTKSSPAKTEKKLLKIGELAKQSGEPVHTIRFWQKAGLLEVASVSPGGYQLFEPDMVERVKEIRRLQADERMTLDEIKQVFKGH